MLSDKIKEIMQTFEAEYVATEGAGGNITLKITPGVGNIMLLDRVVLGGDNYSVALTTIARILDGDGTVKGFLLPSTAIDNKQYMLPLPANATEVDSTTYTREMGPLLLHGDQAITFYVAGMSAGETITVYISGTMINKPTASVTGSGSPSVATTHERST